MNRLPTGSVSLTILCIEVILVQNKNIWILWVKLLHVVLYSEDLEETILKSPLISKDTQKTAVVLKLSEPYLSLVDG
jgi:hypothetical protein